MAAYRAFKPTDWIAVYVRDNGRCGICGDQVDPRDAPIDHIDALASGGAHAMHNWQLAHRLCNIGKGNRPQAATLRPRTLPRLRRSNSVRCCFTVYQHQIDHLQALSAAHGVPISAIVRAVIAEVLALPNLDSLLAELLNAEEVA